MNASKVLKFVLLITLVSARVANAQEHHEHQHDTTEKLGQVNFPISCPPAAQQKFNRALALLHSFQYSEADLAFAEITASDPDCAMAWWGAAMSLYHPLWAPPTPAELQKGWEAVKRARTANAKTQRERDYIAALETFYKDADKLDHWGRARAYAESMEGV